MDEGCGEGTGLAAVALWEKQHGPFPSEEMNEARRSVRAQQLRIKSKAVILTGNPEDIERLVGASGHKSLVVIVRLLRSLLRIV